MTRMLVGALGDSITAAHNASVADTNADASWSTGSAAVGSHRVRLKQALPHVEIDAINLAVSGARSAALPQQAEVLAAKKPDYVTILIGANDLADWLLLGESGAAVETFRRNVQQAVQTLIAANPRVLIVLSGIPDQSRVLSLALRSTGNPAARLMAQLPPGFHAKVESVWRDRWGRANAALQSIAEAYTANVRFVTKVPLLRFEPEHLSPIDFYHPSVEGQKLLAAVTWEQGWF